MAGARKQRRLLLPRVSTLTALLFMPMSNFSAGTIGKVSRPVNTSLLRFCTGKPNFQHVDSMLTYCYKAAEDVGKMTRVTLTPHALNYHCNHNQLAINAGPRTDLAASYGETIHRDVKCSRPKIFLLPHSWQNMALMSLVGGGRF